LPAKAKGKPVRAAELCMTPDTHDTDDDGGDDDGPPGPGPVHDTDGGGATAPEGPPAGGQGADGVAPGGWEPVMPVMRHAEGNGDSGGPELLVKVPSRKWTRRAWGSERVMQPPTDWPGLVTDPDGLAVTAVAVDESELIGLDCETTSLDPRT